MNRIFGQENEELSAWSEAHYERLKKSLPSDSSSTSNDSPAISWPLERPNDGDAPFNPRIEDELRKRPLHIKDNLMSNQESAVANLTVAMTDLLPGRKRAQSGIALRSWCLGQIFSLSFFFACYAFYSGSRLWRPPFFMMCLSLFHFLEFWTHAMFNLPNATISAFLLFDNGWPYMLAHTSAMIETIITSIYFPEWQQKCSLTWQGFPLGTWAGLMLVFVGQTVRSMAIAKAGTNFNHQVQHKKRDTHELVTDGIYGILRHPSYFGFFWWAVGSQIALGNSVCLCVYIVVLWRFFNRRIHNEERHLIVFFGKDYIFYRTYTKIGIPFISSLDYPELVKPGDGTKKSE
ncbi:uncharacterized protein PV09_06545 [Verruconis gallopava]|uniref:Protein-S-isoprenylcysteine O-methyltransferase n=1 Tax=Verruconis gallopava TaxID=253628 RepID=A0A0D2A5Q4_9PEZI|nr:uncharacterized protein PV09_06545 [Verruconis gallopava]KIW02043.1 hypothetical protein PV09_06545 [Verruconis gallopava]